MDTLVHALWLFTLAGFAGLILLNWQAFAALLSAANGALRGVIGAARKG